MAVRPRTATTSTIPDYTTLPTLFCLVRPPPSNSTHPLNLQIQLLVPSIPTQQRNDSNRRSGEYSRSSSRSGSIADDSTTGGGGGGGDSRLNVGTPKSTAGVSAISFDAIAGASVSRSGSRASDNEGLATGGEELSRIPSGGSTRSRGSTNSMSVRSDTASSNGTGTATRRRVTPLLNLSFHSVLPTVVTDAGTDQRVAKFLKRGIEISNLAIIDPIDLSQPPSLVPSNASLSPQTSPPPTSSPVTTGSTSSSSSPSTNGLFTKFKKFTLGSSATKQPSSPNPGSPTSSSFSLFARSTSTSSNLSIAGSPSKFLPSLVGGNSEGAPTPRTVPLLRSGSDELASASYSSGPLPTGYAFVVRKWIRDDLIQVSEAGGIPAQNTAIRIEWVRASDKEYRKRGRTRAGRSMSIVSVGENGLSSSSRRGSEVDPGLTVPPSVPEDEEVGSPSSNGHGNGIEDQDDDGEDSDPEDSERPFICTLFYPSSSSSSSPVPPSSSSPTSSSMSPSPSLRRLQLATLRPAPHHPKLIATLLLPPTLPSIPLGSFSPSQGLKGGVLSNETLRDLVHVSSMFVAIREGLGGLSREKDSQNIAAGLGLVKVKSRKVGRSFRGFGKG